MISGIDSVLCGVFVVDNYSISIIIVCDEM